MIEYRNAFGDIITKPQALQSGIYGKVFFILNKIKKQEHYTNGVLTYIEYFLEMDENESQIQSLYSNVGITFYKDEFVQDDYRKYLVEDYDSDLLSGRRIEVLDVNNDIIYSAILDIDTNNITAISKSAYDNEGNYLYEFEYNLDGTLNQVDIMKPDDYHPTGTFYPQDIGVDPNLQFSWVGFEYYQNANPIIPN